MDISTYAVEAEVEASHWWFVVRRRLLERLIKDCRIPPDARVLDVGTSTGTNLRLLKEMGFTNVQGLDQSDEAIRWCDEKGLGKVSKGDICSLPFQDREFRLVLATDVLEHVDDDVLAAREILRVLVPGGTAIITVPAFRSLWGLQDDVSQHKRRYREKQLFQTLERSGLVCQESFYFNYLLFLPIWVARQTIRLLGMKLKSENQVNSPMLNRLLTWVFSLDVATAAALRPPFGVSIMAIATRKA
jgi:SAM-dependent methyltransferase